VTETAALFAKMFLIGVAVAAPVGAMGVLCIQRVLTHGWRSGAATGGGIATADALYAGLAAFGLTVFSALLISVQIPLRIGGGLLLVWLGWRAFASPPSHAAARPQGSWGWSALYTSALGLTLTNPMTIMAFAAVFAGAGLVAQATWSSAVVVTLGVGTGSLSWWLALSTVVALMRHTVSDAGMRVVNRVSGAVVVAFGLLAVWAGVSGLLG
jgi:putative LysE/RhtB family amino acid efflux pump